MKRGARVGLCALCLSAAWTATALGATYSVNTTASLQSAIATIDTSPSPPDVINVAAGHYVLGGSALSITESMTINGAGDGAGSGATTIDGNGASQVFTATGSVSELTLSGMNVVGGSDKSATYGGGIHFTPSVPATLNISSTAFESNASTGGAGAIYFDDGPNVGDLNISNSTISGNTAGSGVGGGIDADLIGPGALTIADSTISGNSSPNDDAGGLYLDGGTLTITNSTVSGNTSNEGSGLYIISPSVTLTNDTITDNQNTPSGVDVGAGIFGVGSSSVTAVNTIVSGNTGASPASTDNCDAAVHSSDHSLEYNGGGASGCGFDLASADPKLQTLGNNGGPAQTMALSVGSPAIDAGDITKCPMTDERGFARPDEPGVACDLGAYESGPAPTVSITAPADGATFVVGQVVDAGYSCTAGVDGLLAGCAAPVANGAAIDTSTLGPHTFTVTATDTDGQTGSATSHYTVIAPLLVHCTLVPVSDKVLVRGHKKSKHPKANPGIVRLIAKCDQSANATLNGTVTELLAKKHGRRQTKKFHLATVHASLSAGVARFLSMKVPAALVLALKHGKAESAAFTLTATNHNGTIHVTAGIQALKS